ncbi:MAG TPA: tRNA (adenosine(37)-N6)-dimethylallyltransferase MiaA, partial [Trueperaceae bacterium]|nr:tRNA (adenosine(37)-N6)-dimethylallyltransferase MiaA [Trueperaceae bacterium]
FSVVDYVNLAEAKIAEILQRGNIPFVVGGTGFYIRGLSDGLPTTPKMDKDLQAELWAIFERDGLEPIQAELEKHSPSEAIRCQRNPRRVIRAVEIIRRTGRAPNEFKNTKAAFEYNKIILLPNTEVLQKRIIMRTEKMFADGLVAEVEALIKKYPKLATARQAIGYKEIIEYLEGKCSLEAAKEQIIIATRQYAKRQRTWFKREKDAFVIEDISDSDKLLEVVLDRLEPEL